jgi:ribulose-phosphate 3-epimerase
MTVIAPSILAADFSRLGEQVQQVAAGGANRIHVDVMDGHFVPNLSMGSIVVKGLRPVTRLALEVHLMVEEPARFIEAFDKAGSDSILFHQEVVDNPRTLIEELRSRKKRVGMVINPGTPVEALEPYLAEIDLALCMTVWPGFGGQAFLRESIERIRALRKLIDHHNPACELEVDGGIDMKTAAECREAGANVFVAGTAIFGAAAGPQAATNEMATHLAALKK